MISALMYEYLSSWYTWATGTPNDLVKYSQSCGLCNGCYDYSQHGIIYEDKIGCAHELQQELKRLFAEDGLSTTYPFGSSSYIRAQRERAQHKDAARLAWVKSKIDEYEAAQ